MTDWIHCNNCFLRYQPKIKFYVTSCGHLKCEKCVPKIGPEKQCLVCHSVCDMVQLSNNLKPEVQCYFRPYTEAPEKRIQMYAFQHNNALSLLKKMTAKYNTAKGEITKNYKILQDIKKQNAKLKMMITSSSRWGFAASTPAANIAPSSVNVPPNITPIRSVSNNRHGRIGSSYPSARFIQHIQPRYACPRQKPQPQINSFTSQSGSSFGRYQETASFDQMKTPVRSESNISGNPAMISMSHLRLSSTKKSH